MRRSIKLGVIGLMASALALSACGREGTPGGGGGGPKVEQPVAQNVQVSGSPTFEKMKQRNKVIIGVKQDQPNLGYRDPTTGEYSGFDIELARAITAELGFDPQKQIEYKPIPSASREQAISNGEVDYYVGTYTINAKRKEQVGFAGPYFMAGQGLLVRKDDNSITGPKTLKGKKVCSVTGSTPIQRVREQQLTEPENVVEFQKYSQCVDQLLSDRVDAVTTDDAILKGYAAQEPNNLKVVGKPFSEEPYGVGLNKDDKALRDKVNDILEKLVREGDWQKIYDSTLGKSGSAEQPPKIERY